MNFKLIKEEIEFFKNILSELNRNPDVFVSMRIDIGRRIEILEKEFVKSTDEVKKE